MPAPSVLLGVPSPAPGVHGAGEHCPTESTKLLFCQAWLSPADAPHLLYEMLTIVIHPLPERGMLCKPLKSLQSPWEAQKVR